MKQANPLQKSGMIKYCLMGFVMMPAPDAGASVPLKQDADFRVRKSESQENALSFTATDYKSELSLNQVLGSLMQTPDLVKQLQMTITLDKDKVSGLASDFMLNGEHEKAFGFYNILVWMDETNHFAKFHLAGYLTHGIKGFLEPDESHRFRAALLLIEAAWAEMTEHHDEPDLAGRFIRARSQEIYKTLSHWALGKNPLDSATKDQLQAALFEKIKNEPADYF